MPLKEGIMEQQLSARSCDVPEAMSPSAAQIQARIAELQGYFGDMRLTDLAQSLGNTASVWAVGAFTDEQVMTALEGYFGGVQRSHQQTVKPSGPDA